MRLIRSGRHRAIFTTILSFLLFTAYLESANAAESCEDLSRSEQQRCSKVLSERAASLSRTTALTGGWRLVKTQNPQGGSDAIAIIHTGDTTKSDLNFAGITFRCSKFGIEAVLVVLAPLSPHTRPIVSVRNGQNAKEFESSAIQGGEAILLPQEASRIITSAEWQAEPELIVTIKAGTDSIQGAVPIVGLLTALQTLSQNCGSP